MIQYGANFVLISKRWTTLKSIILTKSLALQWDDEDGTGTAYELFARDGQVVYQTTIWKGVLPPGVEVSYSQAQNDADKADFETSHKASANRSAEAVAYEEPTFVAVAQNVVLGANKSLLSLFLDDAETSKVLKLREVSVASSQTTSLTGVVALLNLYRWTNTVPPTGGTVVTPRAHDTVDAIDSDVDVRTGGTLGGSKEAQPLHSIRVSTDEWATNTLDVEAFQQAMGSLMPFHSRIDPALKPFIIRPGQGITFECVTATTLGAFDVTFIFTQVG